MGILGHSYTVKSCYFTGRAGNFDNQVNISTIPGEACYWLKLNLCSRWFRITFMLVLREMCMIGCSCMILASENITVKTNKLAATYSQKDFNFSVRYFYYKCT